MKEAIDLMVTRTVAGIDSSNQYLFANQYGSGHLQGSGPHFIELLFEHPLLILHKFSSFLLHCIRWEKEECIEVRASPAGGPIHLELCL